MPSLATRPFLLLFIVFVVVVEASVAPDTADSKPVSEPVTLGAACECRCCWGSGGLPECNARFHEFLLRPSQCASGCTSEACAALFGKTCTSVNSSMRPTCVRAAPRALALLVFVGAALSLLAFAFLRASPNTRPSPVQSIDELSRRSSNLTESQYGAANTVKNAADVPFLVPPETGVVVGEHTSLSS